MLLTSELPFNCALSTSVRFQDGEYSYTKPSREKNTHTIHLLLMEIDRMRMCYNLVTLYTYTLYNIFQHIVISTQGVYRHKIVRIDLQPFKHRF